MNVSAGCFLFKPESEIDMTLEFIIVISLIAVTAISYYAIRRMCDLIDPANAEEPLRKPDILSVKKENSDDEKHFPFSFRGRPGTPLS